MTYFTIAYQDGAFPPLGGSAALADASPEELRVLLCLIERGRIPSDRLAELARAAGCTLPRTKSALSYWRECGVLTKEEADAPKKTASPTDGAFSLKSGEKDGKKEEVDGKSARNSSTAPSKTRLLNESPTERTARENAAIIEKRELRAFIEACEQTAGRQFNPREVAELLDIEGDFPFSHEYILTLVSYTVHRTRDHRFSFRYLRKMAESLFAEDCLTPEALNAHIAAEEKFAAEEWKLRRLLGIGDRKLGTAERRAFLTWTGEYGFSEEIIGIAYDITVNATGKASIPYMSKLLSRFHAAGCKTAEEVDAFLEKDRAEHDSKRISEHTGAPKRGGSRDHSFRTGTSEDDPFATRGSSFDTRDYLSAALRRSYGDDGSED